MAEEKDGRQLKLGVKRENEVRVYSEEIGMPG